MAPSAPNDPKILTAEDKAIIARDYTDTYIKWETLSAQLLVLKEELEDARRRCIEAGIEPSNEHRLADANNGGAFDGPSKAGESHSFSSMPESDGEEDRDPSTASSSLGELQIDASDLLTIISNLSELRCAAPFRTPVSEEDASGYTDFVREPMDLSTMRDKLKPEAPAEYGAPEFLEDFKLVVDNCRLYNGDKHEVFRQALALEEKMLERLARLGSVGLRAQAYYKYMVVPRTADSPIERRSVSDAQERPMSAEAQVNMSDGGAGTDRTNQDIVQEKGVQLTRKRSREDADEEGGATEPLIESNKRQKVDQGPPTSTNSVSPGGSAAGVRTPEPQRQASEPLSSGRPKLPNGRHPLPSKRPRPAGRGNPSQSRKRSHADEPEDSEQPAKRYKSGSSRSQAAGLSIEISNKKFSASTSQANASSSDSSNATAPQNLVLAQTALISGAKVISPAQLRKKGKKTKSGPNRPWVFGHKTGGETALYIMTCHKARCSTAGRVFKNHPLKNQRAAEHIRQCGGVFEDEDDMVRKYGVQVVQNTPKEPLTLDWARQWNEALMSDYNDTHLASENTFE